MNQNSVSAVVREQMIHTLVPHYGPDLEALVMVSVPRAFKAARKALNCVDDLRIMTIPAGTRFSRPGHMCLDCGGGIFDQHVLPDAVTENKTSSLHLYVEYMYDKLEKMDGADAAELRRILAILERVFLVVCANDLDGTEVGPKEEIAEMIEDMAAELGTKPSAKTHVKRQIRNVIKGWNLLYPDDAKKVSDLFLMAFKAIYANAELNVDDKDADGYDVRKLFRIEEILLGAEVVAQQTFPEATQAEIDEHVAEFAYEIEAALTEMERQWERGSEDMYRSAMYQTIRMEPQVEGGKGRRLVLGYGESLSTLYGAVMRFGNTAPKRWKKVPGKKEKVSEVIGPRPDLTSPEMPKADIVIQMYARGKFVISGHNGMRLDRIAMALREADLRLQGVDITPKVKEQLGSPGNFTYRNRTGREVQALYFPNFRSGTGNNYQSNPFSPASPLTARLIRHLVEAVLTTGYDVDTSDIVSHFLNR